MRAPLSPLYTALAGVKWDSEHTPSPHSYVRGPQQVTLHSVRSSARPQSKRTMAADKSVG